MGDAVTILAIVVLNGLLGFIQEWKAEKAIETLKRMLELHCQVVRDGREQNIDAKNLVPRDIVPIDVGDRIPADLRLTEAINLKTDESTLIRESISINKGTAPVLSDSPLVEQT